MWKSRSWGMCLGALQGCQHFHAGLDTWKMNIHPRQGWKEVVNFFPVIASGSPGRSRSGDIRALLLSVLGAQGQGKEGEFSSLFNPLRDSSFATHPGPGQTLERAELTCRVTWSTLSADGSRMLTRPRSVSTRIWRKGSTRASDISSFLLLALRAGPKSCHSPGSD